jgi:hypothetical protein
MPGGAIISSFRSSETCSPDRRNAESRLCQLVCSHSAHASPRSQAVRTGTLLDPLAATTLRCRYVRVRLRRIPRRRLNVRFPRIRGDLYAGSVAAVPSQNGIEPPAGNRPLLPFLPGRSPTTDGVHNLPKQRPDLPRLLQNHRSYARTAEIMFGKTTATEASAVAASPRRQVLLSDVPAQHLRALA